MRGLASVQLRKVGPVHKSIYQSLYDKLHVQCIYSSFMQL